MFHRISEALVSRRGLGRLAVAGAVLGAGKLRAAPIIAPHPTLNFTVVRNGCELGQHALRFEQSGDDLIVHIDARMRVVFGPITFFHYHHQAEERWSGGRFMSLQTQTDNNGDALRVAARRMANGIRIEATNQAPLVLPEDALPLTHWNVAAMSARLFNPQDGKPLREISRRIGIYIVALTDGKRVQAMRYSLDGKLPIDDWYDENQVWTALQAKVKDGSVLRYMRAV
jgi:hypothetical protein